MNRIIISALVIGTAFVAVSKGLDLQSRVQLQRRAMGINQEIVSKGFTGMDTKFPAVSKSRPAITKGGEMTMGFVKMEDGYNREDLEAAGFNVVTVRGRIAIVSFAVDSAEVLSRRPCVRKLSLQQPVIPFMDKSRAATGVDAIHQGQEGLNIPYTGKGVLAAIVDQGIDPNHIAFLDEKGKSRVTYLSHFDGTVDKTGIPNYALYGDEIYDTDNNGNLFWYPTVDKFTTDDADAYHGTHTMNILGGGYKGEIQRATGLSDKTPTMERVPNQYYGVAPDVQIAASCGVLQDVFIAFGLNGILDYAMYAKDKFNIPSVVSLSLGSTAGPHDPKGLMNQFLDECGKETIVVLSAGNEGDLKIALSKNMTAEDNKISTMIYPYGYRYDKTAGAAGTNNTYYRNGAVMIYSNDATPFEIKAFVMTGEAGNYRRRATYSISSETGDYYLSNEYYAGYVGGSVNATISRYFDGYIGGGSMYDEDLGRWYGVFDYYLYTNPETGINEDGSEGVIVGFEVIGKDGQRIECYCDGVNTWMSNYGMAEYMDGQRDGTISDMAVGYNGLVVGAYTERTNWTSLNGERYGFEAGTGFEEGEIGHYSSYGTLADGRKLPHVCAPGSAVISAVSSPFVENSFKGHEQYIPMNFQAKAEANGNTYYWKQETGTSMSTPFVAGAIALWLEADPTLTIDEVRDVIAKTAKRDKFVESGNAVQWGAGKFDALAGLKEVIKRAGINGVSVDGNNNRLILTRKAERTYDVFVGDAGCLDVKVYNLSGALIYSDIIPGCEGSINLTDREKGVYVVKVNEHARKIVLE